MIPNRSIDGPEHTPSCGSVQAPGLSELRTDAPKITPAEGERGKTCAPHATEVWALHSQAQMLVRIKNAALPGPPRELLCDEAIVLHSPRPKSFLWPAVALPVIAAQHRE
jgi:hypothetical protein